MCHATCSSFCYFPATIHHTLLDLEADHGVGHDPAVEVDIVVEIEEEIRVRTTCTAGQLDGV